MALKMREDVVTDGGIPEKILANAPERAGAVLRGAEGGGVMLTDLTHRRRRATGFAAAISPHAN